MGICFTTAKQTEECVDGMLDTFQSKMIRSNQVDVFRGPDPSVPVIFILGGPGSYTASHCGHLAENNSKLVHLNMDLAEDFDRVETSSKAAMEIFHREMIGTNGAEALIVSGFPRNMEDVAEFTSTRDSGVEAILLDRIEETIHQQVDRGFRMGHINADFTQSNSRHDYESILVIAQFYRLKGNLFVVDMQQSYLQAHEALVEKTNEIIARFKSPNADKNNGQLPAEKQNSQIKYTHIDSSNNFLTETLPTDR